MNQEYAFDTALPLGYKRLEVDRMLLSDSAAILMPYGNQELQQPGGIYYGVQSMSKSAIVLNRKMNKSPNGMIFGKVGSGKSFAAKLEMMFAFLSTEDEIYIIDPEREYAPLVQALGGEIIKIAPGSGMYINPMDLNLAEEEDGDPIQIKSDEIGALCETVLGGRFGLTQIQRSIIDRCARHLYEEYQMKMQELNRSRDPKDKITFSAELCPTLTDFYDELKAQMEPEAKNIALALERYTVGGLDSFARTTNVNTTNRIVDFDIHDIGSGMKEMGIRVCLSHIWNRMLENRKKNKYTRMYVDEIHLLVHTPASAEYLQSIWKRDRKFGGIATGITQDVTDMLQSTAAETLVMQSDFVLMLDQATSDRLQLQRMLNIPPSMMNSITNSQPGHGLISNGAMLIPFENDFPKDNIIYPILTTKMGES